MFSYHKNIVYAATLFESQKFMPWRLVIEEFGPNIKHKVVVYTIVADTLIILSST